MGHFHASDAELTKAAQATCEHAGEQWTDLRASIFSTLLAQHQPVSAYDLAELLSKRLSRRIAANTVYRILDIFVQLKVVRRVESRNAYIACQHPHAGHECLFLVCSTCGTTEEVEDDRLTSFLNEVAKTNGFSTKRPVLELEGTCRNCAAK
jgi:Fur family transcriptional regulator, zinc uptake regulator